MKPHIGERNRWEAFQPQAEHVLRSAVSPGIGPFNSGPRFLAGEISATDPTKVYIQTYASRGADYMIDDVREWCERMIAVCDQIERNVRNGSEGCNGPCST